MASQARPHQEIGCTTHIGLLLIYNILIILTYVYLTCRRVFSQCGISTFNSVKDLNTSSSTPVGVGPQGLSNTDKDIIKIKRK